MNHEKLRVHLEEAHRQLMERDLAFRRAEDDIHRLRERQAQRLGQELAEAHEQLRKTQDWAAELDAAIRDMQSMRAWRLATLLRSLGSVPKRLVRIGR